MARRGLAGKITAVSFALCCCALFVTLATNYWISASHADRELQERVVRRSQELASGVENLLWSFDYETIELVGDAHMASRETAALRVCAMTEAGLEDVYRRDAGALDDVVYGSTDVRHDGQKIGFVEIGLSRAPYAESLVRLLGASVPVTVAVAVLLFFVMSWLLRKYLDRPLKALVQWTELVAQGDYSRAPAVIETNELRNVVSKFSEMYRRVGERERMLKKSEKRFRDLSKLLPAMVFETDAEGRLKFANRAGLETVQYTQEDLDAGLTLRDVVAPEDRSKLRAYYADDPAYGSRDGDEFTLIRKDGTAFPALVYVNTSVEEGTITGLRGVAIDISRQKVLESQLARAGKLEAIGTLAGGVAHDFNNILTAILGYSDLSLMNESLDQEDRENLEMVYSAANRAKDLVQQILAFSRMEPAGDESVEIHSVVEEALSLVRKTLPATIHIEQRIDHEIGHVRSDATSLHRVVMNLCTNSAHAMADRDGEIEVTLRCVSPDADTVRRHPHLTNAPCARLVVRDNGAGIEPHLIEKIFDPFFTTKDIGEGTGMGLSVVHGTVTRNGGAIDVESEPGCGTVFTVHWPIIESLAGPVEPKASVSRPGQGQRILFVDDEPQITDIGRRILTSLNYVVVSSTSAAEALERFRAEPESYDLIITDQSMPGLSGHSLAQEAMRIRPDIPIILCSGYSEIMNAKKAADLGIRAFLTKPVPRNELADVVYRTLAGGPRSPAC